MNKSIIFLTTIFVATRMACALDTTEEENGYLTQVVTEHKEPLTQELINGQGFEKVSQNMEISPLKMEDLVTAESYPEGDIEFVQERPPVLGSVHSIGGRKGTMAFDNVETDRQPSHCANQSGEDVDSQTDDNLTDLNAF